MNRKLIRLRKKIFALLCYRQTKQANRILTVLFNNINGGSKAQVENFTRRTLDDLLLSARTRLPYYKNIRSTNLADFPVIDKNIMRENPDAFTDRKCPFYNKILFNTGGSTGEPFVFYTTRLAGYMDQIHQRFLHTRIGFKKGDKLFAVGGLAVTKTMEKKKVYWAKTDYPDITYGSYIYSSIRLDADRLPCIINDLNERKPAFLRGYPSAISALAAWVTQKQTPLQFQPKGIVLTAETVMPWQIDLIGNTFKTNVYGQYGHSEKCVFAYTEANSLQYICSPYYGFVEILNDDNEHVKIGETGRIVTTSYYNNAMYFIRYDTGDIAEYGGVNESGMTVLNHIAGRKQDLLYDSHKNKINITAFVFGQHFHAFGSIDKWQIIQSKLGEVEIHIIKRNNYTDQDETELRTEFQTLGFKSTFCYVDDIPLTPRGKYRFVVQKLEI
jgi:phenylacetate-CoA ligase